MIFDLEGSVAVSSGDSGSPAYRLGPTGAVRSGTILGSDPTHSKGRTWAEHRVPSKVRELIIISLNEVLLGINLLDDHNVSATASHHICLFIDSSYILRTYDKPWEFLDVVLLAVTLVS